MKTTLCELAGLLSFVTLWIVVWVVLP